MIRKQVRFRNQCEDFISGMDLVPQALLPQNDETPHRIQVFSNCSNLSLISIELQLAAHPEKLALFLYAWPLWPTTDKTRLRPGFLPVAAVAQHPTARRPVLSIITLMVCQLFVFGSASRGKRLVAWVRPDGALTSRDMVPAICYRRLQTIC